MHKKYIIFISHPQMFHEIYSRVYLLFHNIPIHLVSVDGSQSNSITQNCTAIYLKLIAFFLLCNSVPLISQYNRRVQCKVPKSFKISCTFARSGKHTAFSLPHRPVVVLPVNLCNSLFQYAYFFLGEFWED